MHSLIRIDGQGLGVGEILEEEVGIIMDAVLVMAVERL
tara:strand:- start:133 stop:246 length:114 start_codon:yes stop_codon:yes gene_type:complete